MAKQQPTLDSKIASALAANGDASRDVLVALITEATDAIAMAQTVIEAETPRLLDLSNLEPDKSRQLIESSKLRVERMTLAITQLRARIDAIDHEAKIAKWNADLDAAQAEADAIYAGVDEVYSAEFLKKMLDLYYRYRANERTVAELRLRAVNDEKGKTRILEFNHARPNGLFWDRIHLPAFSEKFDYLIPFIDNSPTFEQTAALQAAAFAKALSLKGSDADRAELNRRYAEEAEREEAAKKEALQEFYKKQREEEQRTRLGG
jgi:hypothetical protein